MSRKVLVSLLKTTVLLDVVEVVPSNDNGPLHLHAPHNTGQDSTTDTDIASEGTLLVNVCAFTCLIMLTMDGRNEREEGIGMDE